MSHAPLLKLYLKPLPLLALFGLLLNDHFLKASGLLPPWLSGKLSDFFGLFFFPVLLAALLEKLLPKSAPLRLSALSCIFSTLVFSSINSSEFAAQAWTRMSQVSAHLLSWGTPSVTRDPTDLIALPMVLLAFLWTRREVQRIPIRTAEDDGEKLDLPLQEVGRIPTRTA